MFNKTRPKDNRAMTYPVLLRSKRHIHLTIECIIYLLVCLACLHHHTTLGESVESASIKLNAPLVQDVVKSVSDVKTLAEDGGEASTSNNDTTGELTESDAASIKTITSQISSWMDMKRQRDLSKNQAKLFEDRMMQTTRHHRPFVTLAYAQTLDGMIAARVSNDSDKRTTSNLQLSCPQSFILTHKLRNMHDAILVGGSTFLSDIPRLNVRLPSNIMKESLIQQPMPVVLDTRLDSLQKLLWGKSISNHSNDDDEIKEAMPQDMHPENIRAENPIICCSSEAAKLFLDHLELFQEQQKPVKNIDEFPGQLNRQQKRVYKMTVYKMIDEENDHEDDAFLPIKITVQVTLEGNKVEEADTVTTTFTLLPCQLDKTKQCLSLQNVLQQLNRQFEVGSVMVEGGAGILSSFISESIASRKNRKSGGNKLVDCICATISPSLIGHRGLPVLDQLVVSGEKDDGAIAPVSLRDGQFISLGCDCTFLGKL